MGQGAAGTETLKKHKATARSSPVLLVTLLSLPLPSTRQQTSLLPKGLSLSSIRTDVYLICQPRCLALGCTPHPSHTMSTVSGTGLRSDQKIGFFLLGAANLVEGKCGIVKGYLYPVGRELSPRMKSIRDKQNQDMER